MVRSETLQSTKDHYNVWQRTNTSLTEMPDSAKKRAETGQPAFPLRLLTCGDPRGGHLLYAQDSHAHIFPADGRGSDLCPKPAGNNQHSVVPAAKAKSCRAK
jgi:hypothetical protein